MYKYDIRKFTREGIISTTLDNGQVVLSTASVLNLTCECHLLDSPSLHF